jgi:hypothetical protein
LRERTALEAKAIMSSKLDKLIKLGERAGTTNAKTIDRNINAQDYTLPRQKEKAEDSRKGVKARSSSKFGSPGW